MKDTIIKHIVATELIVPAKPGTLNSPMVKDQESAFAKKFLTGASWTDFPDQPKWIIEVTLNNGLTGIGETYRSASPASINEVIQDWLGLDILRLNWSRLPIVDQRIYEAFESATLDLVGQILNVPVYTLLGGAYRKFIDCNGWAGRRTPEDAANMAFEAMKKGHKVFKFKCSDEDPVRLWTKEIKRRCGTGIKIILDPNQRWNNVETTLELMEGVDLDVMLGLEDPIPHENVEGYKFLKEKLNIPLYRHISLPYSQAASEILPFIKADAVGGYNFNGSAFSCVMLGELANLEGKPCWRGSEVDLGILEAMALHIAAATVNCTIPSDIFGELVREDDLIVHALEFHDGAARVPAGPGLGVKLDRQALDRYKTGNQKSAGI